MQLHQDEFGVITFEAETGILYLAWTEKTANMTDEDFKNSNLAFADLAVEQNAERLLVNVEKFQHPFTADLDTWRTEEIIPRYHRAGVKRFAFVHGPGFEEPESGQKNEGENYVTRHFAAEQKARAWLVEE